MPITPSSFNVLNNPQVVDKAYNEASIEVLADGSQAIDGVVPINILGRTIWYDIRNHTLLKWTGSDQVTHSPASRPQQGCASCGCSTESGAAQETTSDDSALRTDDALLAKRKSTMDKLYDVREANSLDIIELHVNDKCNFRCDYCYLKEGGIEYVDNEMPQDVAESAVTLLLESLPPAGTGVIKFFGGEPFLSYGLMKHVVEFARTEARARGKRVVFTVNTNGTLLNSEKIAWCKANTVRVSISLDGNEASNDKHRKYTGGNGTYKTVLRKAKQFLEEAGYLTLRATVSDGSFELKDSMLEFASLGPASKVKFQADYNLVGQSHVTHVDAEKLIGELTELCKVWVDRIKHGEKIAFGNLVEPMMKAFYSAKTPYRCGAGRSLVAVGPHGAVYPCHRFVGVNEVEMGDVKTGLDGRQRNEFIENRVETKEPCNKCWARYFCGGGCAFNNYFTNANIRDINNVHCKLFRHQVKLGLFMFTELAAASTKQRKDDVAMEVK